MGVKVGEIRRGRAPGATDIGEPVRAVTFDFWNTVMAEPAGGLASELVDGWLARVYAGDPASAA